MPAINNSPTGTYRIGPGFFVEVQVELESFFNIFCPDF
jgi:hypothetical protein